MKKFAVFDIGGTQSRIALFEASRLVWRDQCPTPARCGPQAMLDSMVQLFAPLADQDVEVGVAITGQVVNGCVTAHNPAILTDWHNEPLQQKLSQRLQRPVQVFNDARAAAWGEYRFGSGLACSEFLFLTVSTGVGAGLILQKRLHVAQNGFDGEIGEMLDADGVTLENRASGTALQQLARQHGFADAKQLCDAADAGNAQASVLVQSGIDAIALKLADLAVMLGIQRVAVGGSVGLRPGYLERLRSALHNYPPIYQAELVAAQLGHDAGLFGAADLLANPN